MRAPHCVDSDTPRVDPVNTGPRTIAAAAARSPIAWGLLEFGFAPIAACQRPDEPFAQSPGGVEC
jgi:hypothetical protein